MTYQELKNLIKKKNYQIIEEYNNGFLHELGFKKRKNGNVVYWFCIYSDNFVRFSHSYSMNTGKTNSGINHGLKITYKLIN